MKVKTISARQAALIASLANRTFLAGCTGEPLVMLDAVLSEPGSWKDKILTGAFLPGVNDQDFSSLGVGTTVETIFSTQGLQRGDAERRVAHLPMHYSDFWARLSRPGLIDCVFMTVPAPTKDGSIGCGLTADFAAAPIAQDTQ